MEANVGDGILFALNNIEPTFGAIVGKTASGDFIVHTFGADFEVSPDMILEVIL
jgi:hypothetical protein